MYTRKYKIKIKIKIKVLLFGNYLSLFSNPNIFSAVVSITVRR
jgi:hypothetical protein